jgi:hypothetical protein
MNSPLTNENFGLVIAYVLPGFVALWGVSYFSPTVASWITASQQGAPSVAGFMYVTLASIGTGLTVSGVRWLVIDTIHHCTGLTRPAWKFVNLDDKLQGFLTLNEGHYRYYQFYGNMFIAAGFTYGAWLVSNGKGPRAAGWANLYFLALEIVLFANSRDTLAKYYSRVAQLLGTLTNPKPKKGACLMSNGIGKHHAKSGPASKPAAKEQAPAAKPTLPRPEKTQGR